MGYQDPAFNKDQYWLNRRANAADRRTQRLIARFNKTPIVAVHDSVDWPQKPPTKKAVIKNSKRARKHITYAS